MLTTLSRKVFPTNVTRRLGRLLEFKNNHQSAAMSGASCCSPKDTTIKVYHPLEPLTAPEVTKASLLIQGSKLWSKNMRIISIMLKEPLKEKVLVPSPVPIDREAKACVFDNATNSAYDIVMNVTKNSLISEIQAPHGSQPIISFGTEYTLHTSYHRY